MFSFSKGHSRQSFPSVILFSGIKAVLSQSGLGDILLLVYLGCVSVCAHMLCTLSTGQRITCRSRFSSSSMFLQIELRSQVFTNQVTLCFSQITLVTIYCVLSLLPPLFSTFYTTYCCLLASNKTSWNRNLIIKNVKTGKMQIGNCQYSGDWAKRTVMSSRPAWTIKLDCLKRKQSC